MGSRRSGEKEPLLREAGPPPANTNHLQGQYSARYPTYYTIPSQPGPLLTIPEDGTTPNLNSGYLTESRRSSLQRFQERPLLRRLRGIEPPRRLVTVLLSIITVVLLVLTTVSVPMFVQATQQEAKSDAYVALMLSTMFFPFIFFLQLLFVKVFIDHTVLLIPRASWVNIFLAGFFQALQNITLAYMSIPSRTPPYMQPILNTALIPFTVLARFVIVRRFVNRAQLVCLLILFIGIFITFEPTIFHVDQGEGSAAEVPGAWYYPLLFALAWLPMAISMTIIEKDQSHAEAQFMVYIVWVYVSLYASTLFLFWTNFIPGFGVAGSVKEFGEHLRNGYACFFGADPTCHIMGATGGIYIFCYTFGNLCAFFLIKYAEGALYSAVIQALVTPLATLFWFVFSAVPSFHFAPRFDLATVFIIVGLFIMVPSIVMYSYFSDSGSSTEEIPNIQAVQRQAIDKVSHINGGIPKARSAPQLGTIDEIH